MARATKYAKKSGWIRPVGASNVSGNTQITIAAKIATGAARRPIRLGAKKAKANPYIVQKQANDTASHQWRRPPALKW